MSELTFETAAQAETIARLPEVREGSAFQRDSFANAGETGPIYLKFGTHLTGLTEYLITECGEALRGFDDQWEPFEIPEEVEA